MKKKRIFSLFLFILYTAFLDFKISKDFSEKKKQHLVSGIQQGIWFADLGYRQIWGQFQEFHNLGFESCSKTWDLEPNNSYHRYRPFWLIFWFHPQNRQKDNWAIEVENPIFSILIVKIHGGDFRIKLTPASPSPLLLQSLSILVWNSFKHWPFLSPSIFLPPDPDHYPKVHFHSHCAARWHNN